MNPVRKPWYRTKWGLLMALIFSPFWFIWKKSRPNRFLRTLVGGSAALIVFIGIVALGGHLLNSTKHRSNATPDSANTTTTGSGSTAVLHGYGALRADWNTSHTADNGFTANTAYDPTPGLRNGYTDKYAAVLWINGRALGYQMGFPDGTNIANAKASVIQEFPSDITVLWQRQNNSDPVNICYQMEVRSHTLGQVLRTDGDIFLEFQTITASDTSSSVGYYASNVNNATLRSNIDYKTASSVDGC
jgi:hypothetical protein